MGWGRDDEYNRAKRAIESYSDEQGNFIRPEGRRANKEPGAFDDFLKTVGLGQKPKNVELAKSTYKEAEAIFSEASSMEEGDARFSKFAEAGKKFDVAAKNWPSSYLEQDAMMMAAESYFFAEQYPKAEDRYGKLLKEYPRSRYQDRIDKRRMEIGNYWLKFPDKFYHLNLTDRRKPWNDTNNHGKRVLDRLRLDSPTGKISDDATMALANNAFLAGKWAEALDTYNDLIITYPGSKHLFDAHLMGLKSALLSYDGPDYSQEPLDKAEKLLKNIIKFPEEARREKETIDQAYTDLQNHRAGYQYNRAMFRYNRSEARAARIYCEKILSDYDKTAFVEPARQLLDKLKDMPDEPTRYLEPLAKLFPEDDKLKPLLRPLPAEVLDADRADVISRTAQQKGAMTPGSMTPGSNGSLERR
jgi:outer membrane protein assembly factor BamD (BamD/ComL family)